MYEFANVCIVVEVFVHMKLQTAQRDSYGFESSLRRKRNKTTNEKYFHD